MANKKHRPIVMNRYQKPSKTHVIVKRVVGITVLLAIIEIIILVVVHKKNAAVMPTAALQPNQKSDTIRNIKTDAATAQKITPQTVSVNNVKQDTIAKRDTVAAMKPVVEKPILLKQKQVTDTALANEIKPKETKTSNPVTNEKMFEILNEVRLEKLQANSTAKCISIQIINNSNAENGSRIANYLRKNGYVISGREVISGKQEGIHVDASGTCLKLSVGDL